MRHRCAAICTILASLSFASSANAAVTPFTDSYRAHYIDYTVSDCRSTLPLTGLEPSGAGHPVFLYLVGSGEPFDGAEAPAILRAAAARGFVAASVAYPDLQFFTNGIDGNSRCIFSSSSPSSAVSKVCGRPTAECERGVVVAGFSQGSVIATLAANYDPRVRAAYLLSYIEDRVGPEGTARWQLATTWPTGSRVLPDSAIRIVDGVSEVPPDRRDELNDITGRQCAVTAFSCLSANGSGWYVVQNSEVANGKADHCYFMGADGYTSCSPTPPFDPTWAASTTAPWALGPNLDWLWTRTGVPAPAPAPTPAAPQPTTLAPSLRLDRREAISRARKALQRRYRSFRRGHSRRLTAVKSMTPVRRRVRAKWRFRSRRHRATVVVTKLSADRYVVNVRKQ